MSLSSEEWEEDELFQTIDIDKIVDQYEKQRNATTTVAKGKRSAKRTRSAKSTVDATKTRGKTPKVYGRASKKQRSQMPLFRLRYGRIWVTHVTAQHWCEQQLVFNLEPPKEVLTGQIVVVEAPQVAVGKGIHLERELEVEKRVNVTITSKEDDFAVKVVNLTEAVYQLITNGSVLRREIPMFGAPYGLGIFIIGTIDEIRISDPPSLNLEIVEFKTRMTKDLPKKSQIDSNRLQVMLYKRMFDEMIMGKLTKEQIAESMKLNLKKLLGKSVIKAVKDKSVLTLDHLLDKLFNLMKSVPFISKLSMEYAYQRDKSLIGVVEAEYMDDWLKEKLEYYSQYWLGKRSPAGVDIEDLWKCNTCHYQDVCQWRTSLFKQLESERGPNDPKSKIAPPPVVNNEKQELPITIIDIEPVYSQNDVIIVNNVGQHEASITTSDVTEIVYPNNEIIIATDLESSIELY